MVEVLTTRLLQPFGVEIDADVRSLAAEHGAAVRELLLEHHLLVFRQQGTLTREEQSAFMALLGPVTADDDEVPLVSNNRVGGVLGNSRLAYHSDHEYCPEPGLGVSLHAIEVADGQTSTRFANGAAAYERLDETQRSVLGGCTAVHVLATDLSRRNASENFDPRWPHAIHPIIKAHPTSGVPIVYATEMQTVRISELSRDDSDAVLQTLFDDLYATEHVAEHEWYEGDLIAWDNVALQHGRPPIGDVPRSLQRVSIGKGLSSQFPRLAIDFPLQNDEILDDSGKLMRAGAMR